MNLRKTNLRTMECKEDSGVDVKDTGMLKSIGKEDAAFNSTNRTVEHVTGPQPKNNVGGLNSRS